MEEFTFNSVEEFDENFSIENSFNQSDPVEDPNLPELEGLIDYLDRKPTFNLQDFYKELEAPKFEKGGMVGDGGCKSFKTGGAMKQCFDEDVISLNNFMK